MLYSMAVLLLLNQYSYAAEEHLPAALIATSDTGYTICVDKSNQILQVYRGRNWIMTFPCSTGSNPGDKQVKGDNRTPEGVYFSSQMIDGHDLPAYYGWKAYVLDYPNPVDISSGKNGNGIWIHGRDIPLASMDTHGCVSLNDKNLQELAPYIHPYCTPVVIFETIPYVDPKILETSADRYKNFIRQWLLCLQSKNFADFSKLYSSEFYDPKQNLRLDAFLKIKQRDFSKYNHNSISTNQIQIIGCPKYILAYFLMDFTVNQVRRTGVKILYLEKNIDNPKIISERFIVQNSLKDNETLAICKWK